jgi:hypothetical protein
MRCLRQLCDAVNPEVQNFSRENNALDAQIRLRVRQPSIRLVASFQKQPNIKTDARDHHRRTERGDQSA